MKYLITVGLICTILVVEALSIELPSNLMPCKRGMTNYKDCVSKVVAGMILALAEGQKAFKILPIEPLEVDSMTIGGGGGSVSLKQMYHNIKIHGLTHGLRANGFDVDLDKCLITGETYNDQVDFVADYKVEGKILLLPVTGSGPSNITMLGLMSRIAIHCEKYTENGETYLKVNKYHVKFSPKKVILKFDNLFNGDKMLGDQMNRFINQNSDLLFKELQPPYEETFGLVFAKICNDIFSRIPASKLFPE